jgi:hypothetical protein
MNLPSPFPPRLIFSSEKAVLKESKFVSFSPISAVRDLERGDRWRVVQAKAAPTLNFDHKLALDRRSVLNRLKGIHDRLEEGKQRLVFVQDGLANLSAKARFQHDGPS